MASEDMPDSDSDASRGAVSSSGRVQEMQSLARSVFNTQIGSTDMTAELLLKTALRELAEQDGQRRRETFRYLCAVVVATRALSDGPAREAPDARSDWAAWRTLPVMKDRHPRRPD